MASKKRKGKSSKKVAVSKTAGWTLYNPLKPASSQMKVINGKLYFKK